MDAERIKHKKHKATKNILFDDQEKFSDWLKENVIYSKDVEDYYVKQIKAELAAWKREQKKKQKKQSNAEEGLKDDKGSDFSDEEQE